MVLRAIAEAVSSIKPRCPPSALYPDALQLCGLEPMRITAETNFVNIGKIFSILFISKLAYYCYEMLYHNVIYFLMINECFI